MKTIQILGVSVTLLALYNPAMASTVNAKPALLPYPTYTNAVGINARDQIPMEALWLHLTTSRVNNAIIPKSFDIGNYWSYLVNNNTDYQNYRKAHDNGTCNVVSNDSNDATIERALQDKGLDIYDGAVWQIALALAAKHNPDLYIADVESYQNFLMNGAPDGFQSYYAFKNYSYNGKSMPTEKNAYLLKFISPSWANNFDAINNCNMQWPEWSAVTGEEAWAVLIGPIQSIYLLNDGKNNPNWSTDSQANNFIELAKNALPAIQQMQAPSGGVYRNVTAPGQAMNFDISLENNFSLYAGLTMLEQALKARTNFNSQQNKLQNKNGLTSKLQLQIKSDQNDIELIKSIKKRMVQFFAGQGGVSVFNKEGNYFYASVYDTTPNTKDFAVDVQTWGATVIASSKNDVSDPDDPNLLQAMIDAYGQDVMFNILQSAITKSAYKDENNNLLGVGYTAQTPTDKFYELSGEWTLGAINAAIVLADFYQNDSTKSALLISQAQQMLAGITKEVSSLEGSGNSKTSRLSYLYANKRAFIPFGWYSNKFSSTASTGWSVMVNSCFNPFELGGGNYQNICVKLGIS